MTNLDKHIKKQRHYFGNKVPSSRSYGFSSSHVLMWKFNYKENWVQKNWCFWTMVLEKTLESLLGCKETQLVKSKGNQSWIFIGRTDAEAKTSILWHLMWRTDSLEKPWFWERSKAEGEGDNREWDVWMPSLTQWTCVWVGFRSWWWTGKHGVLQSMGLQKVDTTEQLNWTERILFGNSIFFMTMFFSVLIFFHINSIIKRPGKH